MNGRQRIQAAFTSEGTPEIGAVIPYEGIFIRDHWASLSNKPWWVRMLPDHETQFTWRQETANILGQDWFDLPSGIPHDQQDNISIIEHGDTAYLVGKRDGTRTKLSPPKVSGWLNSGNASVHPIQPPETTEEIDIWMQGWTVPGQGLQDSQPDLPYCILADWGSNLFPMGYINGPLWSCYYLWGFEGLMTRIVDQPDLVRHAVSRFTESTLSQIKVYTDMGVLGLWLEDCMTDMISAAHFHRLNLPYLREITEFARTFNLRTIHYFCGDPTGKWHDLLDSGADALSLEESKKGFNVNITDVVKRVNKKMVVLGNLDAVGILEQSGDADLQSEILRQLHAGKENGNRFIMSLGSPVTPGTPLSRVQRYVELVHTLST